MAPHITAPLLRAQEQPTAISSISKSEAQASLCFVLALF
jgi:hypothetical protein